MSDEIKKPFLTHASGAPVADNVNIMTAGPRGPALLQDVWLIEKLAHFHREVIPERRMHAKGAGAHGTFTVTHDITRYTKASIFAEIGKQTPMFARFSTVAGERAGSSEAQLYRHSPGRRSLRRMAAHVRERGRAQDGNGEDQRQSDDKRWRDCREVGPRRPRHPHARRVGHRRVLGRWSARGCFAGV